MPLAAVRLAPAPDGLLEAYPISTAVNRVANDSEKLIEPLAASEMQSAPQVPAAKPAPIKRTKKDGGQGALF